MTATATAPFATTTTVVDTTTGELVEGGGLIYARLAAVMADLPAVGKGDFNSAQGFRFRGIDAVVNAVAPALRANQVIVVPMLQERDYVVLPAASSGKSMVACRLVVTYRFVTIDGSHVDATVAAEAFDYGDKATAKAMSVAFRVALLQALALPTDEPDADASTYETGRFAAPGDFDTGAGRRAERVKATPDNDPFYTPEPGKPEPARGAGRASKSQVTKIVVLFNALGVSDRAQRLAQTSKLVGRELQSANDLTGKEATKVIAQLQADVDAKSPNTDATEVKA
jgi:hypothetical protein